MAWKHIRFSDENWCGMVHSAKQQYLCEWLASSEAIRSYFGEPHDVELYHMALAHLFLGSFRLRQWIDMLDAATF
jgi:hypothetical protein